MNIAGEGSIEGPWSPGIRSGVPSELRHLSSLFRPENVSTSLPAALELQGLTGLPLPELVLFRPQRLALHELLIRVTADFAVPDGSTIGDLGINFREIARRMEARHVLPRMPEIVEVYERARREVSLATETALSELIPSSLPPTAMVDRSTLDRWFGHFRSARSELERRGPPPTPSRWGPAEIVECERCAALSLDPMPRLAYRILARVLSGLFSTEGVAWGPRELIASLATDIACNDYASERIGECIAPWLVSGAADEGFELLARQEHPVVINTKGASASGKSTLRPLQKKLAGDLGKQWRDFALISPDIWRKQLLDYGALGAAYKYAGAFAAEELQIIDQKLDRYMERKHRRGEMTHLLIDRFRFDSFAADSEEAGSNLLTRFGDTVHFFFMVTPPEQLVERAWKRGLEFGRYKAVDDTLAHAVEAYTGIPDMFFTWIRRSDKRIQFEFLDNTVKFGEIPRTVAYGDNTTCNILSVKGLLDIERFGRIDIAALDPESLYPDRQLLHAERNTGFLQRCVQGFPEVNFADQATGRVYLRLQSGVPSFVDSQELDRAIRDEDTERGIGTVVPAALSKAMDVSGSAIFLNSGAGDNGTTTLGEWGRG